MLSAGSGVVAALLLEAALAVVAVAQVAAAVRRYRRGRTAGFDVWAALEEGLAALLPRPVARVAALEPRLWGYLWLHFVRRRRPGEGEFGYDRRSLVGPVLLLALFTAPVELLAIELLVPWPWLRLLLLLLGLYGLLWLASYYASLRVLPHRLGADGLTLHYGALAQGQLPYQAIASVERQPRRAPGGREGLQVSPREHAAYLGVGGRTDVTILLRTAQQLEGALRPTEPVSAVYVAVDSPDQFVQALRERVGAATQPTVSAAGDGTAYGVGSTDAVG